MNKLQDQVVLIHGVTERPIEEIAVKCAENGALIVTVDQSAEALERFVNNMKRYGIDAAGYTCNETDTQEVVDVIRKIAGAYQRIDVLINNVEYDMPESSLLNVPYEKAHEAIAVDFTSYWNFAYAAAPVMHDQKYGVILNISDTIGVKGGDATFGGIRAGSMSQSHGIACDLGEYNIRVNSLAFSKYGSERLTLTGKMPTDDDIAEAALFLIMDDSKNISALDMRVDAGISIKNQLFDEKFYMENNSYDR